MSVAPSNVKFMLIFVAPLAPKYVTFSDIECLFACYLYECIVCLYVGNFDVFKQRLDNTNL